MNEAALPATRIDFMPEGVKSLSDLISVKFTSLVSLVIEQSSVTSEKLVTEECQENYSPS